MCVATVPVEMRSLRLMSFLLSPLETMAKTSRSRRVSWASQFLSVLLRSPGVGPGRTRLAPATALMVSRKPVPEAPWGTSPLMPAFNNPTRPIRERADFAGRVRRRASLVRRVGWDVFLFFT